MLRWNPTQLSADVLMRIFGSLSMIIGYFILLYVDVKLGVSIRFFSNIFMIPFAVKIKTWDIVVLESFFAVIDLSKFIQLSL